MIKVDDKEVKWVANLSGRQFETVNRYEYLSRDVRDALGISKVPYKVQSRVFLIEGDVTVGDVYKLDIDKYHYYMIVQLRGQLRGYNIAYCKEIILGL